MAGNGAATETTVSGTPVRCILFHGSADPTVLPANADAVARQAMQGANQTIETETTGRAGGREYRRHTATTSEGIALLDHWTIEGLGHAWSGGNPGGSHTDAHGPFASAEMVRFFLYREDV